MMGDRLIGEAPEYTLEQWLRCDPLWPHVFDAPAYAHLQSTLDAVQIMPDEENRFNALKAVFSQLMTDATLTPLFNYHYRISAPPGVNGVRLTPRGWFEFTEALASRAIAMNSWSGLIAGVTITLLLFKQDYL